MGTLRTIAGLRAEKTREELLCYAASSKSVRPSRGRLERAEVKDKTFVVAALAGYKRALFPQSKTHETSESVEKTIRSGNLYVWRLNDPVAIAEVTRETPNTCSITNVYTFPEFRNMGFAKSLVKALMDLLLFRKSRCLLFSSNNLFDHFYSSLGFVVAHEFADYRFVKSANKEGV